MDHLIKSVSFSKNCIILQKKNNFLINLNENTFYNHIDLYNKVKSINDDKTEYNLYKKKLTMISGYSKKYKFCVIYNFYKSDERRLNNLKFFLEYGIKNNKHIECFIIDRNHENNIEYEIYENVKILKYENIGICINGYKYGLNNIDILKYDFICFINDSMIGPFVMKGIKTWTDLFISKFNSNVCCVGSYEQNSIPQTGFFILKKMQ